MELHGNLEKANIRKPKIICVLIKDVHVIVLVHKFQGCHSQGKRSGKKIFFQDHGKVREFCYKSVKISFFEKVRENQSWSGKFFNFLLILFTCIYFYLENFHP